MTEVDVKLPTAKVARRYAVVPRSIERWTVDPESDFPKPIYIRGRKYWALSELEAWERKRATAPKVARKMPVAHRTE